MAGGKDESDSTTTTNTRTVSLVILATKRRKEVAEMLKTLLENHPTQIGYVAWDNANTPEGDKVEALVCAACGRLILLPAYSPWLNPIEMLWRHFRREVTHCELFKSLKALLFAAQDFSDRYNNIPQQILSIIGALLS